MSQFPKWPDIQTTLGQPSPYEPMPDYQWPQSPEYSFNQGMFDPNLGMRRPNDQRRRRMPGGPQQSGMRPPNDQRQPPPSGVNPDIASIVERALQNVLMRGNG